jgi:cysteine desulfurase/selenocysteine lyase
VSYDVETIREREFPWAARGEAIYLNHASTGPLPQRTLHALRDFDGLRAHPYRLPDDLLFATLARGRELVARLIHAEPEEIAIALNTTYGLNLAAFSLPLQPGDVVVTPDLEFPANVYPWMHLARTRGVVYRRVKCCDGVINEDELRRALEDPAVRVVSLSWVGFAGGHRASLPCEWRVLCRRRDPRRRAPHP